mmetsp:Transcript_24912/g.64678  ORF Transcript_24912/g.64678 Transcript_24912/m.64678 type:complete len:297 (+) Transcript_24912:2787-3677(+)
MAVVEKYKAAVRERHHCALNTVDASFDLAAATASRQGSSHANALTERIPFSNSEMSLTRPSVLVAVFARSFLNTKPSRAWMATDTSNTDKPAAAAAYPTMLEMRKYATTIKIAETQGACKNGSKLSKRWQSFVTKLTMKPVLTRDTSAALVLNNFFWSATVMPSRKFQPMRMTIKNAAWCANRFVRPAITINAARQKPPPALPVDLASQLTKGRNKAACATRAPKSSKKSRPLRTRSRRMHLARAQGRLGFGFWLSNSHASTIRRVTSGSSSRVAIDGKSSICSGRCTPTRKSGNA